MTGNPDRLAGQQLFRQSVTPDLSVTRYEFQVDSIFSGSGRRDAMLKGFAAAALLLACLLSVFSVAAQEFNDAALKPAERNRTGTLRELIPGYYVFSSTSFNSGVIATNQGVVVLDALSSPAIAQKEREAIAASIRQPVWFLVSSTFHNNYTWGNVAYQDVIKIGQEDYRSDLLAQMQRDLASPEEQKARLPQVTFRDRLTLHLGGKEIQILH